MKIDKTLPYPYLPGYTGTVDDQQKAALSRLKQLQSSLKQLESMPFDLECLAIIENCRGIVRKLIDNV